MRRLQQALDHIFRQWIRKELVAHITAGFDGTVDRLSLPLGKRVGGRKRVIECIGVERTGREWIGRHRLSPTMLARRHENRLRFSPARRAAATTCRRPRGLVYPVRPVF